SFEFQRNSIPKPRVARNELPWVERSVLPTLKSVAPFEFDKDATAIAVEMGYDRFPRVARSSQPWAGGCNPFRDCRRALRDLSGLSTSKIWVMTRRKRRAPTRKCEKPTTSVPDPSESFRLRILPKFAVNNLGLLCQKQTV